MAERRRPAAMRGVTGTNIDEPAPPRFDQPVSTFVGAKGGAMAGQGSSANNNNNRNELPEI